MARATCRVDPKRRSVTVMYGDIDNRTYEEYRSVSGTNAVFGNGLIQMDIQETWMFHPLTRPPRGARRAYYNPSKVSRYVDKETNRPVTNARGAMIDGSSVYYFGDK